MKKGFRFEIAPTEEQKNYLNRVLGSARFVFNNGLAAKIKEYKEYKETPNSDKPNVSSTGLAYLAKPLRIEYDFLNEIPSIAIQQKLMDLGKGFDGFFRNIKQGKKPGFPKFKSKKKNRDSFRLTTNGFSIKGRDFYIAKCKTPIKVFWSRRLPSQPTSITITKSPAGRYYVSFVCDYDPQRQSGKGIIGIDVGLKTYGAISNGVEIANPKFLKKSLKKLAKAQRKLSKIDRINDVHKKNKAREIKIWELANRNKARLKIAKIHEKVVNQRKDFQHQLSSKLVNDNQVLVLENLNIAGMIKNRRLSKGIADASWGQFRRFLTYKIQESTNGQILLADTFFPSTQLCSKCSRYIEKKLVLGDKSHVCKCGQKMDRDLNAALNLKKMGTVFLKHNPQFKGMKVILTPKYQDFKMYPEYRPV